MENKNNEKGIKSVEILPEENKSEIKKSEITEEKTQRKTKISPQIKITDTDAPGKTIKISGDDIIEEIEKKEDDKNRQEQKIDNKKENNSLLKNNNLFEKQKEKRNVMKTIRTYQDDVVKLMKNQKTSLTKMVIAENKKQKRFSPKNTKQKPTKKIILIGSIISIIIVSSLGVLYFLNEQPSVPPTITELKIPTPIFPNYTQEIFLKRLKKDKIIEALQSEKESISIPLGSIIQLYLTTKDKTKQFIVEGTEGNKLLITTESLFDTLETKNPSSLTRFLNSDFMFGYHSSLGNNPFLIFKVKSYNNAFSEMLKWEKTIFSDFSPIFVRENSDIDIRRNDFEDIVVSNKDVRAILNSKGKIEFAYSFPDKETLVIFNNKTTFQEVLRRIVNAKLERKN